jgi:hypothetical protein
MGNPYKSKRAIAWRNAMVSAINAGIGQGVILRDPCGDMRDDKSSKKITFSFEVSGIPALGCVNYAGDYELRVSVALWPIAGREKFIEGSVLDTYVADLVASGWFERRGGGHIVTPDGYHNIHYRARRLAEASAIEVTPDGFADHGKVMR